MRTETPIERITKWLAQLKNERKSFEPFAREVTERHEEKLLMLGPPIERIQYEMLDAFVERSFDILMDRGIIPQPPEILQNSETKIEYISILAQAQKAVAGSGEESETTFDSVLYPTMMNKK